MMTTKLCTYQGQSASVITDKLSGSIERAALDIHIDDDCKIMYLSWKISISYNRQILLLHRGPLKEQH
jgi:hypothetical protein